MANWYVGKSESGHSCEVVSPTIYKNKETASRVLYTSKENWNVLIKRCVGGFLFQPIDNRDVWISPVLNPADKIEQPYEVAESIIKANNIVKIGRDSNALYTYRDNYYQFAMDAEIESIIYNRNKRLKTRQRKEILNCIKLDNDIKHESVDTNYVCFNNSLLRLSDMKLIKHNPKIICTTKIDHNWLEKLPRNYNSSQIMQSLYTWTKIEDKDVDDKDLVQLILEMCGCCFTYDVTMQKAFIINGDKSNGKSAFMQFLQFCLGAQNYSAVDMSELNDRFTKIDIMGKLANISDDIADSYLNFKTESMFKKFVTGDTINGEFKGQDIVKFNPYATFIYTCNDIPKAADPKGALARRLVYIPFRHTFTEDERDMHIYEKLNTEECAEIFIHLAIKAYRKAKKRGYYTAAKQTQLLATQHTTKSNPILNWANTTREELDMSEDEFVKQYLNGRSTEDAYQQYAEWYKNNFDGRRACGSNSFVETICERYGVESKKRTSYNEFNKRPQTFYTKAALDTCQGTERQP